MSNPMEEAKDRGVEYYDRLLETDPSLRDLPVEVTARVAGKLAAGRKKIRKSVLASVYMTHRGVARHVEKTVNEQFAAEASGQMGLEEQVDEAG
jgi:hypothetical protein